MTNKIIFVFVFVLLAAKVVEGTQLETNSIEDVYNYLYFNDDQYGESTLVIFDLDDTIFRPINFIGSSMWYYETLHLLNGTKNQELKDSLGKLYTLFQGYLKIIPVEPNTVEIVSTIQKKYKTIALTSRNPFQKIFGISLREETHIQLSKIGISFFDDKKDKRGKMEIKNLPFPAFLELGIIFNGDNNKGQTLLNYFDKIDFWPTRVIVVDDSKNKIDLIEKELIKVGIECIAFRYGATDSINQRYLTEINNNPYWVLNQLITFFGRIGKF